MASCMISNDQGPSESFGAHLQIIQSLSIAEMHPRPLGNLFVGHCSNLPCDTGDPSTLPTAYQQPSTA